LNFQLWLGSSDLHEPIIAHVHLKLQKISNDPSRFGILTKHIRHSVAVVIFLYFADEKEYSGLF